jgi:hypothetical protein
MRCELVPASRRPPWPLWAVGVCLLWLGLGLTAVHLAGAAGQVAKLCLFRRVTHLPCPTCGVTRGAQAILRGDILAALTYNPLAFSILAVVLAAFLLRLTIGRTVRVRATDRQRKWAWLAMALCVALNWGYLIVRGI